MAQQTISYWRVFATSAEAARAIEITRDDAEKKAKAFGKEHGEAKIEAFAKKEGGGYAQVGERTFRKAREVKSEAWGDN